MKPYGLKTEKESVNPVLNEIGPSQGVEKSEY
jgi:hypothetical protein